MLYYLTPVRTAIIKKSTSNKWWRCGKKRTLLYCGRNINWGSRYGKQYELLKTLKIKLPYDPAKLPWWLRWYSVCLQCRRPGFNPWVGKISWRRKWQPTPGFLSGKVPWKEEPLRPQSMGLQNVGHDWAISLFQQNYSWAYTPQTP